MKALVTGAGGFIGCHLVEHLVGAGYDVRAFVHYRGDGDRAGWLGESSARGSIEIVQGDIADAERVREVARGCDVIFHLAAQAGITYSFDAPAEFLRVNAGGCLAVLQAAREHGCRVVQMSTSEVLGTAQRVPMNESHPLSPQSPYAASKAAAEAFCMAFACSYGLDVRIARCFNVYGPRQSARAIIPRLVLAAIEPQLSDEDIARLGRGEDLPPRRLVRVSGVSIRRDYTYVEDTVRALRLLAEAVRLEPRAWHVASGIDASLAEIAMTVGEIVGVSLEAVSDPTQARPGASEVQRLCGDATNLYNLTGWQPKVTLREGLARVVEWIRPRAEAMPAGRVA